jgi:hypothetical protein
MKVNTFLITLGISLLLFTSIFLLLPLIKTLLIISTIMSIIFYVLSELQVIPKTTVDTSHSILSQLKFHYTTYKQSIKQKLK